MKGVVFAGKETVRVEEVGDPVLEAPTDALVRVEIAGICGSDLHPYHLREEGLDPGTVMGHEMVGEIVEAGADVGRFRRGDRVLCPFTTSCGGCPPCRSGLTARCLGGALFGWRSGGAGLHGMQAELVRIPLADTTLLEAPAELDPEIGLLLGDVLSTGWFSAEMAGVTRGSVCAVVGCGPVGLMAVAASRIRGAERIFAIDSIPGRLSLAGRLGAHPLDLAGGAVVEALLDATAGRGADSVMEAVGSPEALRLALETVRTGGVIASVGVHTAGQLPFSPAEAYDRNLTFRTGRCSARHFMERVLPLAMETDLPLASVISHRLPLASGPEGYRIFDGKVDGCTKVVLSP